MVIVSRGVRPHLLLMGVAATVSLLLGYILLTAEPAEAAKGGTCASFTAYNSADRVVSPDDEQFTQGTRQTVAPRNFMLVRGTYVSFDVNLSTFEVLDYTLESPPTGGVPAQIFERKTPLFAGTLTGPMDLRVVREHIRMERGTGQNLKIQAKDCQEGGLFQHEPEPGLSYEHVLGAGFTYEPGTPGQDGPLCFTNGILPGYDSPELATLVSSTATTATWSVPAGGRMGMVVGEDAVEGGCNP